MNIYTPTTIDEAIRLAELLNPNDPREVIACHAAFGHHFAGDIGACWMQAYCLKGKPTLSADAMAGIVRRSGKLRYLRYDVLTEHECTITAARTDEPSDLQHQFTFTWDMAQRQGLTRNRNWSQMPKQMLRARALTMILRSVFPDAVSGIYSADEIADCQPMPDDERAAISAQALGEELRTSAPPAPQAAPTPAPQAAPAPTPPAQSRSLHSFATEEDFWAVVDDHELPRDEVEQCIKNRKADISAMLPEMRERFWYSVVVTKATRTAWSNPNVNNMTDEERQTYFLKWCEEFPILSHIDPKIWHRKLGFPAFTECLLLTEGLGERHRRQMVKTLSEMEPDNWVAYDYFCGMDEADLEL